MAQEKTLSPAEVYTTDPACRAAVERLQARGMAFEEAAREAAKTVVPAPQNVAAQDARYLLAPEEAAADLELLDEEFEGVEDPDTYAAKAYLQVAVDAFLTDSTNVGPIPPERGEGVAERRAFTHEVTLTESQIALLPEFGNPTMRHGEECLPTCKLLRDLRRMILAQGRVPHGAPTLSLQPAGQGEDGTPISTLRMTVTTVPGRNRDFVFGTFFGDTAQVEDQIEYLMGKLDQAQEVAREQGVPSPAIMVKRGEGLAAATVWMPPSPDEPPPPPPFGGVPVSPEVMLELFEAILGEAMPEELRRELQGGERFAVGVFRIPTGTDADADDGNGSEG